MPTHDPTISFLSLQIAESFGRWMQAFPDIDMDRKGIKAINHGFATASTAFLPDQQIAISHSRRDCREELQGWGRLFRSTSDKAWSWWMFMLI
jgi:hypothetical protein